MSDISKYQEWSVVFETGTDYEGDLVRDRLDHNGVNAVVLTKRDHAFNLNVGDMSPVYVMVPPDEEVRAREILAEAPISDAELEAASMAQLHESPAHSDDKEAALDSGIDKLNLGINADDDEDEE